MRLESGPEDKSLLRFVSWEVQVQSEQRMRHGHARGTASKDSPPHSLPSASARQSTAATLGSHPTHQGASLCYFRPATSPLDAGAAGGVVVHEVFE